MGASAGTLLLNDCVNQSCVCVRVHVCSMYLFISNVCLPYTQALVEILLLSGGTAYANFKDLAHAWGREKGFHHLLATSVCERRGEVERKKRSDAGRTMTPEQRQAFRDKLKKARLNKDGKDVDDVDDEEEEEDVEMGEAAAAAAAMEQQQHEEQQQQCVPVPPVVEEPLAEAAVAAAAAAMEDAGVSV